LYSLSRAFAFPILVCISAMPNPLRAVLKGSQKGSQIAPAAGGRERSAAAGTLKKMADFCGFVHRGRTPANLDEIEKLAPGALHRNRTGAISPTALRQETKMSG
jgi:hypothetical protein